MKSYIKIALAVFILSSCNCNSIYIQLPPDRLPVLGDAELIRVAQIKKEAFFKFKHLKNRSNRLPVLKGIEKLSKQGLNQFKTGKLTLTEYAEFSELARLGTQVVLWLTIIENNNSEYGLKTISIPYRQEVDEAIKQNVMLNSIKSKLLINTTEDEILVFLLALSNELKSQLKP